MGVPLNRLANQRLGKPVINFCRCFSSHKTSGNCTKAQVNWCLINLLIRTINCEPPYGISLELDDDIVSIPLIDQQC